MARERNYGPGFDRDDYEMTTYAIATEISRCGEAGLRAQQPFKRRFS